MLLTSLALMAAPVQGTPCFGDHRIEIRGVIDTVLQAPTAPFQSIASGDLAELDLAFAGDVGCITAAQLDGRLATPHCCELRIGGAVAPLDAGAAPCLWGEVYSGPPAWQTEAVEADAPFAGGTVWAELRMTDPQGLVGIGMDDLIHAPIDVPSVTAAGFSVSLELKDSHGALLATVDVLEILGTPGFQTGGNYCTANANSTGLPARMAFSGSWDLAQNDFTIAAMDLP